MNGFDFIVTGDRLNRFAEERVCHDESLRDEFNVFWMFRAACGSQLAEFFPSSIKESLNVQKHGILKAASSVYMIHESFVYSNFS